MLKLVHWANRMFCSTTCKQREFVSVFAQELETCVKAVHGVSGQVHRGRGSLCLSVGRYTQAEGVCVCLWAGTHRQREFVCLCPGAGNLC